MPTDAAFARFAEILARSGARDALAFVLSLSDYRYIGIFRFQDGKANAAIHYDREQPQVLRAQEVPDTATYCCYVRNTRGLFARSCATRPRIAGAGGQRAAAGRPRAAVPAAMTAQTLTRVAPRPTTHAALRQSAPA